MCNLTMLPTNRPAKKLGFGPTVKGSLFAVLRNAPDLINQQN
jgi:hypothetical protein